MFAWNSVGMIGWLVMSVNFGTVILLGSIGEIITEKVGHLNLGIPGIMFIGAISGFASVYYYEQATADNPNAVLVILIGVTASLVAGALAGLLYGFLTITLRANQNVTGITLTTFGIGIAKHFGGMITKNAAGSNAATAEASSAIYNARLPIMSETLGGFGEVIFGYGFMVYVAIVIAVLLQLFMKKTQYGLNLRSIGEHPATADAAGINVTKYKYIAILAGSAISGLGGFQYVVTNNIQWSTALDIEGMGWLAVALVIFATWKPVNAIWGGYMFGFLSKASSYAFMFIPGIVIPANAWKMLPYIATIIVLVIVSFRKKRENQAPTSLGLPYFREER